VPTWFGDVSLAARHDESDSTLHVRYDEPKRRKPKRTRLHVPPIEGLRTIVLNGKSLREVPEFVEL
jgi:hypothetical protein